MNALGLLAIGAVLLAAFLDQFLFGELPCPLCILQRAGFALAGAGFALNLLAGIRPAHYGLAILGALAGAVVSLRQIALHVVPGTGAYGAPVLGLHLYSWAFLLFGAIVAGTALMLMSNRQFTPDFALDGTRPPGRLLPALALGLFALLVLGNALSTLAECGIGLCPDDPHGYRGIDVLRELLAAGAEGG
jgi:disulfide bond formation protein DsbB